jgi:hypothetical protein
MNWYVGQKVVCVRGNDDPRTPPPIAVLGGVYTIEEFDWEEGELGFHFVELERTENDEYCSSFDPSCFRPLDALTEQMDRIETEGAPIEEPQPEFA